MKGVTSNFDLKKYAKDLNLKINYIGFAENLEKTKTKKGDGGYIINLGNDDIKGTHWTVLIIEKADCIYFDSFGVCPEDFLTKWYGNRIPFNKKQIQGITEEFCGQWTIMCLYFLQKKCRGMNLKDRMNFFTSKFKSIN